MEPTRLIDDVEFSLPPEFLTDDDFLVEKENNVFKGDEYNKCLFPYEPSHGFGFDSGFGSTVKPIGEEEKLLAGLTRKIVQSSLEDDFSGGFFGNDAKAWCATRPTLCGRRNQNYQTRVSSQAVALDQYYSAAEELAMMNINGYNNRSGRELLDLPRKHPLAGAKITNDGFCYYSRQSLQYHQKLQAIQFQQQLLKQHHQLVQQSRELNVNNNKLAGPVDLSPPAWRGGSGMRDGFLRKQGSAGTGVFLPRRVDHATAEAREKPMLATVSFPARVVEPSVRSSPSHNDATWRQRSNSGGFSSQMKMEQAVKELRLPADWAY